MEKITTVVTRTATDGSAVQIAFVDASGASVQVTLGVESLRDAISALITAGTVVPQGHTSEESFAADENPIHPQAMSISAIEAEPKNARLALACGLVDLQFSIPISDLVFALEDLKNMTELDPNGPQLN